MAQAEVERLPAPHRQSGQGPRLAIGVDRVVLLDERDQVFQQVVLEGGKCGGLPGERVARPQVFRRSTVREDDDHRHDLLVGVEVVEDHVGDAAAGPFVLIAADAVKEIQDRIFLVLRIAGRRVDLRLALRTDGGRIILDGF
jgi:hypothetical protein